VKVPSAPSPRAHSRQRTARTLTHVAADGGVRMVDVAAKAATERKAVATAIITMAPTTLRMIARKTAKKGDVLATAQIAGIQAAKKAAELIPLCHALPLTHVAVEAELRDDKSILVRCTAACVAQTGVEMEALTGAAVAALTIYDMCKAVDRGITIEKLQLQEKLGGRSGHYRRVGR